MRTALWIVVALTALSGAARADEILTKDEAKEVDAVIASMFSAGLPDTAKAVLHSGKLSVQATFDPGKDPTPLPSSASTMQMTNGASGKMTYGYEFSGLHLALADGSWIISLAYHFKPGAGDSVNASGAPEMDLASLTATAAAAHPFHAEKDAVKYLEGIPAERRARAKAELDFFVPITHFLKLRPDDVPQAIVLLARAGWTDAPAASLSVADQRARSYWQLKPWTVPDGPFDPTGAYAGAKQEEAEWRKEHPQVESEAPQIALRRALFRWCRAQLMAEGPEDALVPAAVAAAAAKAMVDPGDPQGYAARTDALLAATRLPLTPPENADLPARLQSWEARQRQPRMVVNGGPSGGGTSLGISTAFAAPAPAYEPKKEDLDALVALLADERPSRFWDFGGARTVGDNAWRAVAALLKADPRTLAGHPTDRPWTAAERKEAATAVQRWWKAHGKENGGK